MDEKHIYEILNLAEDEVDAVSDARVIPRSPEDESEERYVSRPLKSRNRTAAKSKAPVKKKSGATEAKKKTASKKTAAAPAAPAPAETGTARQIAQANAASAKQTTGDGDADQLPIINGVPTERRKKPRTKPDPEYDLRYPDYTIQLTKGLTNTVVKRIYLAHRKGQFLLLSAFFLGVVVLCFIIFSVIHMVSAQRRLNDRAAEISSLRTQNEGLSEDNAELRNRVTQLSVSVNRNIEDKRAQAAADEEALMPRGFPLSQYASYEIMTEEEAALLLSRDGAEEGENTEEENENAAAADSGEEENDPPAQEPDATEETDENGDDTGGEDGEEGEETPPRPEPDFIAHFESPVGSRILASGNGTVTRVLKDDLYGNMLVIDHHNGYTSVYRNRAEAKVNVGDAVSRGDTLFVIGEEHTRFGYQIRFNETDLDPSEIIQIGG
ncbi:MAG: M23 family metallopeptidase [Lachnospiraceae bacterium]|nr:M23 family metallopeptidase [Lachnospiraceae bacterium]